MMRHVNQFNVFVLAIFLLTGCATTGDRRTQNYRAAESSPPAPQQEYDAPDPEPLPQGPPPPAPPAYGVSHVKSVGFLKVFGGRRQSCSPETCSTGPSSDCTESCCSQEDCAESCARKPGLLSCLRDKCRLNLFKGCRKSTCVEEQECCADDDCCGTSECCQTDECCATDDCCSENQCCIEPECCAPTDCNECAVDWYTESQCTDDRHPCLAERLEDPFLEESVPEVEEEQELKSPVPAAPEPNLQPHAWLPSPYSEISASSATGGAYFPDSTNNAESIVEPPQWPGRRNVQQVITHRSIAMEKQTEGTVIRQPVIHRIVIQPR